MAAAALRPVLPEVPVILVMTAAALLRHLHRPGRLTVALRALQLGVRPEQRKVSFLGVIEDPQRPAVRGVAGLAFLAEAALVHVILRVAIDAYGRRPAVGQRRVALRRAHDSMQSEQGKLPQVMIEYDVGAPGILPVTRFASALDLAAVRVFAAMAARTILGELLRGRRCGVAGVAVDLGVRAHQRELGFRGMIIGHRPPAVIIVAVLALGAESRCVRVVGLVAAVAILWNLVLVIAAAVAGQAVDLCMRTEELVPGLLEMIVLRRLPILRHVALCAIFAARSPVLIVGRMASRAGSRRRLVAPGDVTGIAAQRRMGSRQSEFGFVMIEPPTGPGHGAVTLCAGLCELPAVDIVRFVAADAGGRRLAPGLARLVAALASEGRVRALQCEVGEAMIELCTAELHDVGVAALVFGMAGAALARARVGHAPVIAAMIAHIGRRLLVAVETQRRLGAYVGAVMAAGAILFLLDVRLRHLARHEQRLHRSPMSTRKKCRQRNCRHANDSDRLAYSPPSHER